jgi:hypothetical protein
VTPYIKTRTDKPVSLNVEEEAHVTGFKLVHPFKGEHFAEDLMSIDDLAKATSLVDIGERHKIGREIHVLQK